MPPRTWGWYSIRPPPDSAAQVPGADAGGEHGRGGRRRSRGRGGRRLGRRGGGRRAGRGLREPPDVVAGHGAGEVAQGPAGLENRGLALVHVVHQEDAFAESGQDFFDPAPVEGAAGRRALEPRHDAVLVAFGLEPADEPGPGVGQALVVEVDRVLGRQHDPQPEGARLLEQGEQRLLGGRVADRREVAEDLVHVEQRAQAGGPRLGPHPGEDLVQQLGDEEHALGIPEVADAEDGGPGPALRGEQQPADVERLALQPGLEPRGGQDGVEAHGELEPLLGREEGVEVHDPHAGERRFLDRPDQAREVEALAAGPGGVKNVGDQGVLAAGGIGLHAGERQQRGGRALHAFAQEIAILPDRGGGRLEAAEHVHGEPGAAAGRVDRELGRRAQARDALRCLIPLGQALAPPLGLARRELLCVHARAGGFLSVDPGQEVFGGEVGEREQQVGQVALGVDRDHRDVVDQRLLEQAQGQPGLAAAGHADDDGVGGEVLRVVQDEVRLQSTRIGVERLAQVEHSEVLVRAHAASFGKTASPALPGRCAALACARVPADGPVLDSQHPVGAVLLETGE